MAATGWARTFDDPIPLPGGGELRTLRDAGHHVTALSKADQAKAHWQTAAHELMMARIGFEPGSRVGRAKAGLLIAGESQAGCLGSLP